MKTLDLGAIKIAHSDDGAGWCRQCSDNARSDEPWPCVVYELSAVLGEAIDRNGELASALEKQIAKTSALIDYIAEDRSS